MDNSSTRILGGLFTRRERWGLSLRGWLVFVVLVAATGGFCFCYAYAFLSVTERAPGADVLVVEGWIPEFATKAAALEFASGRYKQIYTTGGPVSGSGGYTNDYNTAASIAAGRLRSVGLPAEVIQMVPSHINRRDRTYASAIALRQWLQEKQRSVPSFDIITENAHARRTRLLFQQAFGDKVRVGVIGVDNPDYKDGRWWESSEEVKNVVAEGMAYLYAKFLFYPPKEVSPAP